jgi:group I intron endonuclease
MTAGVYIITNIVTGDRYIGQSRELEKRLRGHQLLLEAGKHPNKHLQKDCQIYGSKMFAYGILEAIDICNLRIESRANLELVCG